MSAIESECYCAVNHHTLPTTNKLETRVLKKENLFFFEFEKRKKVAAKSFHFFTVYLSMFELPKLPKNVAVDVLSEWIDLLGLSMLDSAFCNKVQRSFIFSRDYSTPQVYLWERDVEIRAQ
jgi:hypothetical protein